jgi:hypothetical protein
LRDKETIISGKEPWMATVKTRDESIEVMEAFNAGTSFRGAE